MKEEIIRSILSRIQKGEISKEAGLGLCYEVKNFSEPENNRYSEKMDIAVIGLAGQYPKAKNLKEFWRNLSEGKNCITTIPPERWDWKKYFNSSKKETGDTNQTYSKYGGFLDGIDEFDAMLFHISPNEARYMDPQERLFLETAWETFEDAGYSRTSLQEYQKQGRGIGIFVGATWQEYQFYSSMLDDSKEIAFATNACNIANRVSYFFNLSGSSMSVDTACSSSMTALHLACESLRSGSNSMALAGGVNLTVHPNKYVSLAKFQFMSEGNECRSFGKGGDGYIPSEGVGAVLLKPLSEAIKDRDHIYGVIKGSAINHGGKASGYTVPNPIAQGNVIQKAIENAGINPRTISYLEAHGTGTALGDPIEIEGLERAYRQYTNENQFCSIGSVKSNIGHCEGAAGIASLTKVLLQLKYKKRVASLFSKELNPNIDFEKSPFFVQQELEDWKRPEILENGEVKIIPRRAAISSFGAGGSNAHVIVEEYVKEPVEQREEEKTIIVLSAKTQDRLEEYAKRLLKELEEKESISISSVAYTLQTGRESLECRLAFTASSIREVESKLKEYLDKKEACETVYQGVFYNTKKNRAECMAQEDLEVLYRDRKDEELAMQWVKGADIAFDALYDRIPEKISLPFYPFSQDKYWVQDSVKRNEERYIEEIHPLVKTNVSNVFEQKFCAVFTGEEAFFADHVVNGKRILPGVAYLEMAQEAVRYAYDLNQDEDILVMLKNVVWISPIEAKQREKVKVYIALKDLENDRAKFEIYCEGGTGEKEVHCYGQAEIAEHEGISYIDIRELEEQCNQKVVTHEQCYGAYEKMGIHYGKSHCGIEEIRVGRKLTVAHIKLDEKQHKTLNQYMIHPALADAALQSTIGLMIDFGQESNIEVTKAMIPFVLEQADIYCPCTEEMYAVAQFVEGCSREDSVQRINIDLYDATGKLCVQFKSYTSREPKKEFDVLYMEPVWKEQKAVPKQSENQFENEYVILIGQEYGVWNETMLDNKECEAYYYEEAEIGEAYESYAAAVFHKVKEIMLEKRAGKTLIQLVISNDEKNVLLSSLSALLKTASMENINITVQTIQVDKGLSKNELMTVLRENEVYGMSGCIRQSYDKRYIEVLEEVTEIKTKESKCPWKKDGVYLISGGGGSLGFLLAEDICKKAKESTVILTGRSPLSEEKQEKVRSLHQQGGKVYYYKCDISDYEAVKELTEQIQNHFGSINGVIHAAGVIRDSYIRNKTEEEFEYVLRPKTLGLRHLDRATQEMKLDFFVAFSSTSAITGNLGQADYATANAYMDNYIEYRNNLVQKGRREGISQTINWPLWKEGGMHVDAETKRMMLKNAGMAPLESEAGIQALYYILNQTFQQIVVIEGNVEKLRTVYLSKQEEEVLEKPISTSVVEVKPKEKKSETADMNSRKKQIETELRRMVVDILDVEFQKVSTEADISEYGFDSLTNIKLSDTINSKYDVTTTPTVFYEYVTIKELAEFLLTEFPDKFVTADEEQVVLDTEDKMENQLEKKTQEKSIRIPETKMIRETREKAEKTVISRTVDREPIAIVGMSGEFPNSEDMEAFWNNLVQGTDCIVEIPKDRWDWREYYGDPATEVNKCNVKWGGFIKDIRRFDPLFFGISPREAELMDPEQRLLMMHVWNAVEDAGYSAKSLAGSETGMFIGTMSSGYDSLITAANLPIEGYTLTGMVPSVGPNRMSYFMDFHGPSEPVETACSSSIVAVQRAISAIREGNCDKAIAGGINAIVTPDGTISCNKSGMLSPDGHCKTFSDKADGYVRSEGVGIFFLKKLSDAEADGDHIYGVIIGIAENHGGHATSLTAPNPKAQSALIQKAYRNAQVDPRTVTYIETHGTGTELGDPTEINGLKSAFKALYEETGSTTVEESHCIVGAVKTNVGHLEVAAGAAGLAKVLLMLKHKQIPKILHLDRVNPYIQLENSPFRLAEKNMEWVALKDQSGAEIPRRAGISSFGFGGANAHVVIEEYIKKNAKEQIRFDVNHPAIIVLSAKTQTALLERASRLYGHIDRGNVKPEEFSDMVYTLMVGRDSFEKRMAFLATSLEEVKEKLRQYIKGESKIENFYVSRKNQRQQLLDDLFENDDTDILLELWCKKNDYNKIANAWVQGMDMNWTIMFAGKRMNRISLPGYPFAQEQYWIPEKTTKKLERKSSKDSVQKPLVPVLTREEKGHYSFELFLSENETFLTDHIVNQDKVLPGVAYIEILTEALKQITDSRKYCLSELVWLVQCRVNTSKKIYIDLVENQDGYEFNVYSREKEDVGHAKGYFVSSEADGIGEKIDITEIQGRLYNYVDVANMYTSMAEKGIEYKESFQVIRSIQTGDTEAISLVQLPAKEEADFERFGFHPSIMDGALQTMASVLSIEGDLKLPFYVETVEQYAAIPKRVYIYAVKQHNEKFILRIADETGKICVKLNQVLLRAKTNSMKDAKQDMYFIPQWIKTELEDYSYNPRKKTLIVAPKNTFGLAERIKDLAGTENVTMIWLGTQNETASDGFVIDVSDKKALRACVETCGDVEQVYFLGGITEDEMRIDDLELLERSQKRGVLTLFRLLHELVDQGLMTKELRIVTVTNHVNAVIKGEATNPMASSVFGLIKSCQKEFNETSFCSVDIDLSRETTEEQKDSIAQQICKRTLRTNGEEVVIRGDSFYIKRLVKARLNSHKKVAFKENGVYFVLGGTGGIGMELAKYLTSTYHARVALIGRSELSESKKEQIANMEKAGGKVLYVQADGNNLVSMKAAVEKVNAQLGPIQGVFHSAIVLRDKLFALMEEERFLEGLNPKVKGSYILNRSMQNQPLDFMLFFSSAQSFACSMGQCNYASGCGFKDTFAEYLDNENDYPVKTINWGYWGTVGVVASEKYEKLQSANGIISLYPEEGMEAVEQVLANAARQVMVMKATKEAIKGLGIGEDYIDVLEEQKKVKRLNHIMELAKMVPVQKEKIEANAEAMKLLEQYTDAFILDLFQKKGFLVDESISYDILDMRKQLKIQETYWKLFEVMLDFLVEGGLAEITEGKITVKQSYEPLKSQQRAREMLQKKNEIITEQSEAVAYRKLLETCLDSCLEVMQGRKFYTEVLFPNDSVALVENIYRGNEYTDYYNRVVAKVVEEYVASKAQQEEGQVIRILEIGAGVGGTSRQVFEQLGKQNRNIEYYYTDISKQFIEEAAEKFRDYSYIKYELLNVEKDVETQNFEKNSMDIILATNVIHATSNIANSIKHIKDLLKARGIVILNEITKKQRFSTMTFGLTTGWWLYEDQENRIKGTPALLVSTWSRLLEEQGFSKPFVIDYPDEIGDSIQSVIVAKSDGMFLVEEQDTSSFEDEFYGEFYTQEEETEPQETESRKAESSFVKKDITEEELLEHTLRYIMNIFSDTLKMSIEQLDADCTYEKYGVDSMLNMELNKRLKDDFGKIPGTLLFECITMRELSEYLVENKREQVIKLLFGEIETVEESKVIQEDVKGTRQVNTMEDYINEMDDDRLDEIFKMLSLD